MFQMPSLEMALKLNNLTKKLNIFLELTVMSLERLTSSGFGTKNSQITRPPRAIIVPGTMKE